MPVESLHAANYGPPRRLLSDDDVFLLDHFDVSESKHKTEKYSSHEDKESIGFSKNLSIRQCNETRQQEESRFPNVSYSRAELLAGQLTCEGDEYIDIEVDALGEQKVDRNGFLKGGRKYAGRTFQVVGHGQRLFMLGTEVARITSYRDSYLLFLKNKTLRKIIASQEEKEDLIVKEIIPYSYRSRQIAIVTARSVFRRFGSRVIVSGKRGKDDYFEQMAKDAGIPVEKYLEDSDRHRYTTLPSTSVSTVKSDDRISDSIASKSLLSTTHDVNARPSPILDILQHAKSAVEFNRQITIQRKERELYFHKHFYKR
ncbi:uncharacterized protein T551_02022 [Pneumocystis jirovecii RU7]|uniref:Uncharacterized protein n=1 Tax=Pneumocystis jirovecii (strain RU7) TaxID=1408657 RepID=A0A0W4ZNY0_PNEJ7|nr:uncharacterized protein T551_02022 [Pneumocystis jirovecii RU7]KTW30078.1 hypothetical protein T551_02022 [Pneumocystis jirovecii RU7]